MSTECNCRYARPVTGTKLRKWLSASAIMAASSFFVVGNTAYAGDISTVIPFNKSITLSVVSDSMTFNGLDMVIYELDSTLSIDDLADFYSQAWKGAMTRDEVAMGELSKELTTIMAHREGDNLITIQVTADAKGGTRGFVAISDIFTKTKKDDFGGDLPIPAGSRLVSDIVAHDPGKLSHTWVIQNNQSATSNLDYYRTYFSNKGWGELEIKNSKTATAEDQALPTATVLNRGSDEVNLSVGYANGTSTVVVVKVEK